MSALRPLCLLALLISPSAWAVPAQLTHQGRLLDSSGAAINGNATLTQFSAGQRLKRPFR